MATLLSERLTKCVCGKEAPAGANFCYNCGMCLAPIDDGPEPPAPKPSRFDTDYSRFDTIVDSDEERERDAAAARRAAESDPAGRSLLDGFTVVEGRGAWQTDAPPVPALVVFDLDACCWSRRRRREEKK